MADAKRIGEMKECHHGRVAPSPLEPADILLGLKPEISGELLLGESLLPPELAKIPAHELAHIHLRKSVYLL